MMRDLIARTFGVTLGVSPDEFRIQHERHLERVELENVLEDFELLRDRIERLVEANAR